MELVNKTIKLYFLSIAEETNDLPLWIMIVAPPSLRGTYGPVKIINNYSDFVKHTNTAMVVSGYPTRFKSQRLEVQT